MEVSNPSMHLNQLLKEVGKSDTTVAVINQARGAARRRGGAARQRGR